MANETQAAPSAVPRLQPLHGGPLVLMTIAVALSTFMEVLDTTIVNVAVPHISGSLGVSPNEGTWAISSYSMASAVMQPLTGWIAKQFGEVKTFVVAVALFVVFSMMCGLASSMPMLVVFRLLQGAGSGPMVSLALSLLLANYPKERQGIALALWAMTVVIAPVLGPILGGWLTDNYSWPWIFYINVPIGLMAGIITWFLLHKRESKITRSPIDAVGLVLLIGGVGCLQFMLDNGNDKDWFSSTLIVVLGLIAVVGLTFLVAWELHAKHPVIDLGLFKQRNFTVGVTAMSVGMLAFFAINVVSPLWLQTTLGYTASWSGLTSAWVGVLAFVLAPIVGSQLNRFDLRVMISIAFVILSGCSYWLSTFTSGAAYIQMVWPRLVMGMGIPLFFIPLNQIYLSGLRPDQIASASGMANFFRTMGSSISTAVTVTLWQHRTDFHHASLTESVNNASASATNFLQQLKHVGLDGRPGLGVVDQLLSREAATLAVNDVFWLCSITFIVLIPMMWLAKPPFGNASAGPGGH